LGGLGGSQFFRSKEAVVDGNSCMKPKKKPKNDVTERSRNGQTREVGNIIVPKRAILVCFFVYKKSEKKGKARPSQGGEESKKPDRNLGYIKKEREGLHYAEGPLIWRAHPRRGGGVGEGSLKEFKLTQSRKDLGRQI